MINKSLFFLRILISFSIGIALSIFLGKYSAMTAQSKSLSEKYNLLNKSPLNPPKPLNLPPLPNPLLIGEGANGLSTPYNSPYSYGIHTSPDQLQNTESSPPSPPSLRETRFQSPPELGDLGWVEMLLRKQLIPHPPEGGKNLRDETQETYVYTVAPYRGTSVEPLLSGEVWRGGDFQLFSPHDWGAGGAKTRINLVDISLKTYSPNLSKNNPKTISFNPPTPEDNGAPSGSREGSGSHGLCKITNREKDITPLIALMPEVAIKTATKDKNYVWGETTSAHPTFWFYVAYPVDSQLEFVLQDEAENEVYQTSFTLDKTPGIISLTLPPDRVNLVTGKSYHWYLYVMCNSENSPDDFVEGWVKRVNLNAGIDNQLALVKPLKKISIYAENGLWFDTLSSVDRLRQSQPGNKAITAIWTDLLQQVGLDKISQKPVVRRYNLAN